MKYLVHVYDDGEIEIRNGNIMSNDWGADIEFTDRNKLIEELLSYGAEKEYIMEAIVKLEGGKNCVQV